MDIEELRAFWRLQGRPQEHELCKLCGRDMRPRFPGADWKTTTHWRWERYCPHCGEIMMKFEDAVEAMKERRYKERIELEQANLF